MRNTVLAMIFGIIFSGCALIGARCEPVQLWEKPDATAAEFFQAKFICIQQAQFNSEESKPGLNWGSFNECMKAFGFTPVVE